MRVTPGLRRVCATLVMASVLIAGIPDSVPDRAYAAPALDVAIVYSTASDAWCDTYGRGYAILEKQDVLYDYLDGKGWNVAFISDADLEWIDVLHVGVRHVHHGVTHPDTVRRRGRGPRGPVRLVPCRAR